MIQKVIELYLKFRIGVLDRKAFKLYSQGKIASAIPLAEKALTLARDIFPNPSQELATSLNSLSTLYREGGRYAEAEPLYQRALTIREQVLGHEHPDVAISLNNLANLYADRGKFAEAEPLYQRAIAIREQALGQDHPAVAGSLNDLGSLYREGGRYAEVEPLYQRALAIREQALGQEHPDVAISLNSLASLYRDRGKFAEAEPLYQRALAIREQALGHEHPDVAISLNNLANLYADRGEFAEAEPFYQRALAIREQALEQDHPHVATSLGEPAALYRDRGKFAEAEPLYQRALAIEEQVLGQDHPHVATSLNNLASLYRDRGKFAEAEPLYQRALAIREQVLGQDHPDVATSLNDLGSLYREGGRYAEVEPLYQRALAIREQALGQEHLDVATSLGNLASFYREGGKFAEAESLYQRALTISEQVLGQDHPNVATILGNLALLYREGGKFAEAESLCQRALTISEQVLGQDHPNVATILGNLALLYRKGGKFAEAEFLCQRALAVKEKALGQDHPNVATSLNDLAILYADREQYGQAEPLYRRALDILIQLFAERGHPCLRYVYQNYALLLIKQEKFTEAIENFIAAAKVDIKVLADRFQGQTEAERLAYRDRQQYAIDCLLSCLWEYLPEDTEAIAQAFEVIYLWKSIATAVEIALSAAISRSDDPELQQIATERQQLRRQLTQITQKPPTENLEAYQQEVKLLQTRINELEKAIAAKVPQYELMETTIDHQAINLLVPAGDTLVDFVRFDLYDLVNIEKGEPHYLAFVLTHEGLDGIKLVKLGRAAEIDELITKFREVASHLPKVDKMGITGVPKDPTQLLAPYEAPAIDLRKAILDPLNIPENKGRVFFAPDGDLNLVPFGILPLDNEIVSDLGILPLNHKIVNDDYEIVSDRWSVHYISASRDLRSRIFPPAPATKGTILANPNYDFPADPVIPQPTQELPTSGTISTLKLDPLPQTEPLAIRIAQSLQIEPYLGNDARAANLRQLRSPQYLIIATHGLHGLDPEGGDNPDPMRAAGLALAGYNTHRAGGELAPELEKGLFTARNLLELDLWGTQLAVLLACRSGMGLVRQGEGIFGLKRALAIAGVPTLIVSLWDVPVQASILLMDKFFECYRDGAGTSAPIALQQAQSYIRNITRQELLSIEQGRIILQEIIDQEIDHLIGAENPLQHPVFWGAWICQSKILDRSFTPR
jgi:tetratricopeptide (TPR) repeat protein